MRGVVAGMCACVLLGCGAEPAAEPDADLPDAFVRVTAVPTLALSLDGPECHDTDGGRLSTSRGSVSIDVTHRSPVTLRCVLHAGDVLLEEWTCPPGSGSACNCTEAGGFAFGGPEGPLTLTVTATDGSGDTTTEELRWRVDTTPPEVALAAPLPPNPSYPDHVPLDSDLAGRFAIAADQPATLACQMNWEALACATDGSFVLPATLRDGSKFFEATVTDCLGRPATAARVLITDGDPPDIRPSVVTWEGGYWLPFYYGDYTGLASATCVFDDLDDDAVYGSCMNGGGGVPIYMGASPGRHVVRIRASDPWGHTSETTADFEVSTGGPGRIVLLGRDLDSADENGARIVGNAVASALPYGELPWHRHFRVLLFDGGAVGTAPSVIAAAIRARLDPLGSKPAEIVLTPPGASIRDELVGFDVLVVPDQNDPELSAALALSPEWNETLRRYVDAGGTVIVLDGLHDGAPSETWRVLTGGDTPLLDITGASKLAGGETTAACGGDEPITTDVASPHQVTSGVTFDHRDDGGAWAFVSSLPCAPGGTELCARPLVIDRVLETDPYRAQARVIAHDDTGAARGTDAHAVFADGWGDVRAACPLLPGGLALAAVEDGWSVTVVSNGGFRLQTVNHLRSGDRVHVGPSEDLSATTSVDVDPPGHAGATSYTVSAGCGAYASDGSPSTHVVPNICLGADTAAVLVVARDAADIPIAWARASVPCGPSACMVAEDDFSDWVSDPYSLAIAGTGGWGVSAVLPHVGVELDGVMRDLGAPPSWAPAAPDAFAGRVRVGATFVYPMQGGRSRQTSSAVEWAAPGQDATAHFAYADELPVIESAVAWFCAGRLCFAVDTRGDESFSALSRAIVRFESACGGSASWEVVPLPSSWPRMAVLPADAPFACARPAGPDVTLQTLGFYDSTAIRWWQARTRSWDFIESIEGRTAGRPRPIGTRVRFSRSTLP